MSTNGTPRDPQSPEPAAAEQNVARLLRQAYQPERPNPAFVQRAQVLMLKTARELATKRKQSLPLAARRLWPLAAAAAMIGLFVGLDAVLRYFAGPDNKDKGVTVANGPSDAVRESQQHLKARPRPAAPVIPVTKIGDTLTTEAGQRRIATLPDGSIVYLNQSTVVRVVESRRLVLERGEIFIEVSPRKGGEAGATFIVTNAGKDVAALGTKFAVRSEDKGPAVFVTQGKIKVSGVSALVQAGQLLSSGEKGPQAAPRASHVLDWTRDVLRDAESPLVPASQHAGGALKAQLRDGRDARISLHNYHIDVHVEDGFARTTIDQTYFNEEAARLEGTFLFPLPADAQLSRLAMYVDGKLMEGGMAERQRARVVFDTIVSQQKDPALLEWVDGTTFQMRVFPLEPRQEKRIILSYTQKLPNLHGRSQYRFPSRHSLQTSSEWSFHANLQGGVDWGWNCDSHTLKPTRKGQDLLLDASAKDVRIDRDVVLDLTDPGAETGPAARFSRMDHEGSRYLMVRYRPTLPAQTLRQRRDWVFLIETSGQRDSLLARVQVDVVKHLLSHAGHDDTFTVLTAAARVQAFSDKPTPATPANAASVVQWLSGSHLVGGLDLAGGLDAAAAAAQNLANPTLVHLGSGVATLGEHRADALLQRLPERATYVGVAVGHRWARGFMKGAAERSGGYCTQINPDEPVSWRAFELFATLDTPRMTQARVTDASGRETFLCHDTIIARGEEVVAVARLQDSDLPGAVTVEGHGFPRRVIPVENVVPDAGYLPRTWAKLEIDRLLIENANQNRARIIDLSKSMYVMTPFTSLLVLETDAMYEQFKVDRGRKDHWAMYSCPRTLQGAVVPVAPPGAGDGAVVRKPALDVLKTIVVKTPLGWESSSLVPSHLAHLPPTGKGSSPFASVGGAQLVPIGMQSPAGLWTGQPVVSGFGGLTPFQGGLSSGNAQGGGTNPFGPPNPPGNQGPIPATILPRIPLFGGPETRVAPAPSNSLWVLSRAAGSQELLEHWAKAITEGHPPTLPVLSQHGKVLDARFFSDLVSHAPGLNTTEADVRTTLALEALETSKPQGKVDPAANTLIEKARARGWQTLVFRGPDQKPVGSLTVDGLGRCVGERVLPNGLLEKVVCDGEHLWHLYPELGLAAKRKVSRYYLKELAAVVPWLLPSAEELAREADVRLLPGQVVAVVPHDEALPALHLVFAEDGSVQERRTINRQSGQVMARESNWPEDLGDRVAVKPAQAPDLGVDVKGLAVVPMPMRSPDHVAASLRLTAASDLSGLDDEAALRWLMSQLPSFPEKIRQKFADRRDLYLGLTVLLGSQGVPLANLPWASQVQGVPALQAYAVLVGRMNPGAPAPAIGGEGFLGQLSTLAALSRPWTTKALTAVTDKEALQVQDFVANTPSPVLGWALVDAVMAHEQRPVEMPGGRKEWLVSLLSTTVKAMETVPELAYLARYELAQGLQALGRSDQAQQTLRTAYQDSIRGGFLPPLDPRALTVLKSDDLAQMIRQAGETYLEQDRFLPVVVLAWQGAGLLNGQSFDDLLGQMKERSQGSSVRPVATLALAHFHGRNKQIDQARALINELLQEPAFTGMAPLWRVQVWLTRGSGLEAEVAALEKALDAEFQGPIAKVDLESVRRDYEFLLRYYHKEAHKSSGVSTPRELVAKTIRAADCWRSLDPEAVRPCREAASVFAALGLQNVAWDYLTTPLTPWTPEKSDTLALARQLASSGDRQTADLAFRHALAAEPTNYGLVWERIENLRKAGKDSEVQALLKVLVESDAPEAEREKARRELDRL